MQENEKCVGCTGRQRVMPSDMQNKKQERDSFVEWVYRRVQSAEYEISLALYNGVFSLVGLLPVLPGT